jgi:oligoribonuclease
VKKLHYVWFDTEYSHLDLKKAALLQVAAFVTDASLRRVLDPREDVRLAIRLSPGDEVSDWVGENLSTLVEKCRSGNAFAVERADEILHAYVTACGEHVGGGEDFRPILAGNSVHADWWLAYRYLPRFLSLLHYRHLDVTAIKLEWKRHHPRTEEFDKEDRGLVQKYFPGAVTPALAERHDALYDAEASLAELAFYRKHFFRSG